MRRIIKKIGGDRIGSGKKMQVTAHGYGYSTNDKSKVRRISMSFGTIVPMGIWMMTSGSRIRMKLDALITSNALLYQLYGSAKFQVDVFSARMALYNPKMLLNLNDQGYEISDIKFPQMELTTRGFPTTEIFTDPLKISNWQVNPSSLLRCIGVSSNGQHITDRSLPVTREHNAMWMLMYYQTVKEYYANKQEKIGYMIHTTGIDGPVETVFTLDPGPPIFIANYWSGSAPTAIVLTNTMSLTFGGTDISFEPEQLMINISTQKFLLTEVFDTITRNGNTLVATNPKAAFVGGGELRYWEYSDAQSPALKEWDLKAVDRMMMKIMSEVESPDAVVITAADELPYSASLKTEVEGDTYYSINTSQEGLCVGTYQSDVFNNWLDNETINNLNARNKVTVNSEGEFTIDMLNLTQKLYNYDMRIGVTDGTLEEWREMTYAQVGKTKSLKPVYEGGLSKEIVFDMVVSTASTEDEPLGSIASRGQFGNKHKGGYVQIDTDEEKLVMVLAKITPRLVYNQGNDWTTNLKTLDDLHKPALDKIGYQNLLTDQMAAFETEVDASGVIFPFTAGKQPAWQWYRTNYDDALGNMADTESYKVFGREYAAELVGTHYRIKDLTTYIDPRKFNDVFAIQSLDAMNFDVQVGMDVMETLVMSEEVIPGL
ncbi:MAG: major capsid protein [Wigfec virus K19_81]|nr:MAG: major capsid protein [Wigfec virus K19_81]